MSELSDNTTISNLFCLVNLIIYIAYVMWYTNYIERKNTMEYKFNQNEYQKKWKKEKKAQFKVDLNKEEKKELDELLEKEKITKAQFLRNAIKDFKDKNRR